MIKSFKEKIKKFISEEIKKNLVSEKLLMNKVDALLSTQERIISKLYSLPVNLDYETNRLLCHTKEGHRMMLDTRDPHIAIHVIENGTWEEHIKLCIKKVLSEGDTFLDIGANIGLHTVYAGSIVGNGGKLICCEAVPRTFEILMQNLELNGLLYNNKTVAYNLAISDKNDKIEFEYFEHHAGMSSITVVDNRTQLFGDCKQIINIDCRTIDFLCSNEKIDVVKIDVEGYEYSVLLGMSETIFRNENIKILIEFDPQLIKQLFGESIFNEYIEFLLKNFQKIYCVNLDNLETIDIRKVTHFCDILLTKTGV